MNNKAKNKTNKQMTTKKQAKKRAVKTIARPTTTTTTSGGSRFEKIEDEDILTLRVAKRERVNGRLTMLPRSTKDRRRREWTHEETHQAIEWYKKGMARNTIAKLLDVSHAPLNKMLFKNGALSAKHVVAAYKAGYIK